MRERAIYILVSIPDGIKISLFGSELHSKITYSCMRDVFVTSRIGANSKEI